MQLMLKTYQKIFPKVLGCVHSEGSRYKEQGHAANVENIPQDIALKVFDTVIGIGMY